MYGVGKKVIEIWAILEINIMESNPNDFPSYGFSPIDFVKNEFLIWSYLDNFVTNPIHIF